MMPRAARHVVVTMQVAVRQNVQTRALLITDDSGERVLKLLAEADIHHARVEGATPHAVIKPAWPRIGTRDRTRKDGVGGDGEHAEWLMRFGKNGKHLRMLTLRV